MRYWRVERDCGGFWVPTDFRVGGESPSDALAECERIAGVAGWVARVGREVQPADHYCDFVWVNAS